MPNLTDKGVKVGNEMMHKAQFQVSGILDNKKFQAGGILDNKKLLSRNYLFNFRATFSPANNRISARSENYTDWKSAINSAEQVSAWVRGDKMFIL